VGVFVDATIEESFEKIDTYGLDAVQLHGEESSEFCGNLKKRNLYRTQALGVASLKNH